MKAANLLRVAAWLLLAGLAWATLSPIGLRPTSHLPLPAERAAALFVVGFAFALAYPRHILLVSILVIGSTAVLELLQLVTPTRHGRMIDLEVKLAGAALGLAGGWLATQLQRRLRS